jgi:CRISPR-associated protein Csd1
LIGYYRRLEADPSHSVAAFGFSRQRISFCIVLQEDGSLASNKLVDMREQVPPIKAGGRTKLVPRDVLVPFRGNRSGQKPPPNFLWDNTGYVLGKDARTKPDLLRWKHEEFIRFHLSLRDRIDDLGFEAVCRFLETWRVQQADHLQAWEEINGTNLVFRLRGKQAYVHESRVVQDAWLGFLLGKTETKVGMSLVSGHEEELARLHEPAIKGVIDPGGQAEKKLVSFDKESFRSYAQTQSYNAPIGVRDAFRYATALNRLLADRSRRVTIGDATVVFWTDRAKAKDSEKVFAAVFGEEAPKGDVAESGKTVDRLREFLQAARQGQLVDEVGDPDAPFYILGLSPNASRINVRFWLAGTVAQFAERLADHVRNLEMAGVRDGDPPLVLRRLLDETVPPKKGWPDREKIPPQLAGELARAVLARHAYPQSLFSAVIRRLRAEGFVTNDKDASTYRKDWKAAAHRRAAILKAYLARNKQWEVPVALDRDHPDEAYHLGRLFAALEKTQEDAARPTKLNSTIKDRFFGAASATPATVFPRLLRLHQHHIDKIENPGWRVNREKLIGEICSHISRFPPHLPLEKQGLFHIAYYHQRQDLFPKKDDTGKETTDE